MRYVIFFFFNDTATTEIYTLSLHDALPISLASRGPTGHMLMCPKRCLGSLEGMEPCHAWGRSLCWEGLYKCAENHPIPEGLDRKSTRLNSSHANISYAVFCLKKKILLYTTL